MTLKLMKIAISQFADDTKLCKVMNSETNVYSLQTDLNRISD